MLLSILSYPLLSIKGAFTSLPSTRKRLYCTTGRSQSPRTAGQITRLVLSGWSTLTRIQRRARWGCTGCSFWTAMRATSTRISRTTALNIRSWLSACLLTRRTSSSRLTWSASRRWSASTPSALETWHADASSILTRKASFLPLRTRSLTCLQKRTVKRPLRQQD